MIGIEQHPEQHKTPEAQEWAVIERYSASRSSGDPCGIGDEVLELADGSGRKFWYVEREGIMFPICWSKGE